METIEFIKLLEEFKKLSDGVHLALKRLEPKKESYRSEHINELATALAKAQGEYKVAGKNKSNPFFKSTYADLESVIEASRPALSKYGLSVVQNIIDCEEGQKILHTILLHNSGQYIESRVRIVPAKNDVQSISSTVTYAKRMAYASLCGVVTGDEDDDGEEAVAISRAAEGSRKAPQATKSNARDTAHEKITEEQLDEFHYELQEYPDLASRILDGLKIESLSDIPKSEYGKTIRWVREKKTALSTATK